MGLIAIGASGFIGRHVISKLADAGREVVVLHRDKTLLPVRSGVTEFLGDRPATRDMMPGVAELFGATHQGVFLIREPNKGARWTAWELAPRDHREYRDLVGVGEFSAQSVFPTYYLQTLAPTTGKPILEYHDEVAGCVNSYGKGRAYLVGTLLGHGVAGYNDLRNAKFLAALLERAGVSSDSVGVLKRRRRILENQAAWFSFNGPAPR
jgi:hypothetical protein